MENASTKDSLLKEIREEIQKEGPEFTKFLEMVASFADDIEEEHKRYRAAAKAMKQTSGVDQYDVLKAADRQLKRLSEQESMMASSLEGKRTDLKEFVRRGDEIDAKVGELKKQLGDLEREKSIISDRRAAKEKEIDIVEESYKSVAEHLSKQITQYKEKIQKFLSDEYQPDAAPAAAPAPEISPEPALGAPMEPAAEVSEEIVMNGRPEPEGARVDSPFDTPDVKVTSPMEANASAARNGTGKRQKTCPSCNGAMDWYAMEKMWKCYVCGYELKARKK